MSQAVLIVEDEESAARLIAGLCAELGLQARTSRSGREGLALLAPAADGNRPFAAVVLDLVLAELDGFQVARTVREAPWGADLPLIVVSGVYKQLPPEFVAQARPDAFLPKPFEASHMRGALMRLVKGGPSGDEGDFSRRHPSSLLVDLMKQKATGTLTLTRGQTVRRLVLQAGQIRFAQSNVKAETAGAAQVASGLIKQAAFDRAVADAKQRKVPLHEALAAARVMPPEQLKAALRQQTQDAATASLSWADGTWRFEPQTVDRLAPVPDTRMGVVSIVSEAARRFGKPAEARAWLQVREPSRVQRTVELERELFALRVAWPGEGVSAVAQAGRTVAEILPRVKDAELPLLQALCESGLLQLSNSAVDEASPAPLARSPEEEDRGKVFSARESEARRQLFADRDHYKDASHYEMLGVQPGAGADEIKSAYFALAKKYHSDGYSGLELGSARRVAEELFRRVAEAHTVLTDARKRGDYDVLLERKAKGLPTDVGAILKAEGVFLRGEAQYRNGKFEEAEASFREAISLNHAEAEFYGYLGAALFRGKGKAAEALEQVEKALKMDGRLPSALCFAGVIHEALGDPAKARKLLEQALELNPNHAEAQRELSRLRKKTEARPASVGGVLSRLFKSKGK
jgi:curved DNA-binding protein CbpA/CheY-like chemotaxis protein